ncbi:glycoside hydrolase family 15 protein (plasmid) [Rhizobium sp. CB3090]|uniref:glycoside hydrolase family 15 protein n=1 Tax=Rhizobium sp. CB3090 TaxID=3039156 RepID=UPI0024B21046|nr:glycoside hydrolase family 15 protein [Rhizobium sp. CB3090]WFU11693.1 glycoside hydrolase family 15 protein [Rhizobium sp. CB3090]
MRAWRPDSIEGHAMLSDGQAAALVYEDGTIDWLCMPRFDSAACFAALLGTCDNGGWWLHPVASVTGRRRRYVDETLVLETVFETDEGEVAVIDFMPVERGQAPDIVRIVEGRRGTVEMISELALRFDNGRIHPLMRTQSEREMLAIAGPNAVILRFDAPIKINDRAFESRFWVKTGERRTLTMTWFRSFDPVPDHFKPQEALDDALRYWRGWSKKSTYRGEAERMVKRSLLTLKGLIHASTGGIIAAATASLPECPGGGRNWDYRYCWLRDATFTLMAFMHTGHEDEAREWIAWLRRALAGEPIDIQPFYRVDGERHLLEWQADWLPGFKGAQPVRFGNAAVSQLQLDLYGEVIDAICVARRYGLIDDGADIVRLLADTLENIWTEPDAGIWESRGHPRQHVYSKAMCWVAFDRASRLMEETPGEARRADRWRRLADCIRPELMEKGVDAQRGTFTRAYDDKALDAAVLRLPIVGFIDANDECMRKTVAAIEENLCHNGYVYRYSTDNTDDGAAGEESKFLAVGCWLADVYSMQGRHDDAHRLFEAMLAASNDLGLLSEQYRPDEKSAAGNFPQALSHVALINTALTINSGGSPPRLRLQKSIPADGLEAPHQGKDSVSHS